MPIDLTDNSVSATYAVRLMFVEAGLVPPGEEGPSRVAIAAAFYDADSGFEVVDDNTGYRYRLRVTAERKD